MADFLQSGQMATGQGATRFGSGIAHPMVWIGVITATLLTLFVIDWIWWLSIPSLLAVVISFVSTPFIRFLKRRGLSHDQALIGFLVLGSVVVAIVAFFVLPWWASQLYASQEAVPAVWERMTEILLRSAGMLEQRTPAFAEAELADQVKSKLLEIESQIIGSWLPDAALRLLSWIPPLLLVPYLAFFIVKDGAKFKSMVLRGVANAYFEKVLVLFEKLDHQVKQYFRGLMAMTGLDTVTLAFGLWLIGLPFGVFGIGQALWLGLLSAVLAWIPYVGTASACLIMVLVCITQAPDNLFLAGAAVALFVVVRLIDDFVYTPMTVGRSLRSHPLLTVLIVFAGGYVGGILGLLTAMPVLGIWMAIGEVFEDGWFDERLRARHQHSRELRRYQARAGLDSVR